MWRMLLLSAPSGSLGRHPNIMFIYGSHLSILFPCPAFSHVIWLVLLRVPLVDEIFMLVTDTCVYHCAVQAQACIHARIEWNMSDQSSQTQPGRLPAPLG